MLRVGHEHSLVSNTVVTYSIRRPPGIFLCPFEEFKLEWCRLGNQFWVRALVGFEWIPFVVEDIRAVPAFQAPRFRNTSSWIIRISTGFIIFSIHHSVLDKLPISALPCW